MPVQLHLQAAWPFHDGVHPNGILEGLDEDAGARCARRSDRLIHVGNEVSGPLEAKRMRNRSCVRERRERSDRSHDGLKLSAACGGCHGRDNRFAGVTAEGGDKASDEGVYIGWRYVDALGAG